MPTVVPANFTSFFGNSWVGVVPPTANDTAIFSDESLSVPGRHEIYFGDFRYRSTAGPAGEPMGENSWGQPWVSPSAPSKENGFKLAKITPGLWVSPSAGCVLASP